MAKQLDFTYNTERFLNDVVGNKILKDPTTAIVELVANAWDAGATRVDITWPSMDNPQFSIIDNGHGMSDKDFKTRWLTFSYDRAKTQGLEVEVIYNGNKTKRTVFGKNGRGRHAAFCFNFSYEVETKTKKNKRTNCYKITKGMQDKPIKVDKIDSKNIIKNQGTGVLLRTQRP